MGLRGSKLRDVRAGGEEVRRWKFSVKQGGLVVASGDCPTEEDAKREAAHYAMMYSQDGPVEVKCAMYGKEQKPR